LIDVTNEGGQTALHIATEFGFQNIVKVLLEAGAKVETLITPSSCLFTAVASGNKEISLLLWEKHPFEPFKAKLEKDSAVSLYVMGMMLYWFEFTKESSTTLRLARIYVRTAAEKGLKEAQYD
jgi:ankyrin repeat protein